MQIGQGGDPNVVDNIKFLTLLWIYFLGGVLVLDGACSFSNITFWALHVSTNRVTYCTRMPFVLYDRSTTDQMIYWPLCAPKSAILD